MVNYQLILDPHLYDWHRIHLLGGMHIRVRMSMNVVDVTNLV